MIILSLDATNFFFIFYGKKKKKLFVGFPIVIILSYLFNFQFYLFLNKKTLTKVDPLKVGELLSILQCIGELRSIL